MTAFVQGRAWEQHQDLSEGLVDAHGRMKLRGIVPGYLSAMRLVDWRTRVWVRVGAVLREVVRCGIAGAEAAAAIAIAVGGRSTQLAPASGMRVRADTSR